MILVSITSFLRLDEVMLDLAGQKLVYANEIICLILFINIDYLFNTVKQLRKSNFNDGIPSADAQMSSNR